MSSRWNCRRLCRNWRARPSSSPAWAAVCAKSSTIRANLGCLAIDDGGRPSVRTSPRKLFARLTSEFNSHLAVHYDQIMRSGTNFHAVVHAQPRHLTYLSHIPRYQYEPYLNRHLLRWQPELIVNLPEGIGHVPFLVPGSSAVDGGHAGIAAAASHRDLGQARRHVPLGHLAKRAADRIEYAETAARYEYMNLVNHEQGEGLSVDEIRAIAKMWNIDQTFSNITPFTSESEAVEAKSEMRKRRKRP